MFGIDPAALPMAALAGVLLLAIIVFHIVEHFVHKKHRDKGR